MGILHVVMFGFLSAACAESTLQVSGQVGGQVVIRCSGHLSTDDTSSHNGIMHFCKGACSPENILIQAEKKKSDVIRKGRYSMEVRTRDAVFNVTMRRLRKADAGRYLCGVDKGLNVLYQEVNLKVLDASAALPGSTSAANVLQTEAEPLLRRGFPSSTQPSVVAQTLHAANGETNRKATSNLSDTSVVIIVSVSLALLVCAIIPLIFYSHWRSNAEGQNRPESNKDEDDHCKENSAVQLQSLESDGNSHDASQYAAVYQALDPKSLE